MPIAGLRVVNEIERNFDAAAGFGGDFFLDNGHAALEGVANDAAEPRIAVENLADFRPKDVLAADVKEALDRAGDQDGSSIAGEKHDAVLQIGKDLVEILAESGEYFFHVADALAKALNFAGNLSDRVVAAAPRFALGRRKLGSDQLGFDGAAQFTGSGLYRRAPPVRPKCPGDG